MEKIIDVTALTDALKILLWDRSKTREELAELAIGLIEEAGRECDPESLRPRGRWEKHRTMHGFVYCSNCKDVYLDEEWLVDGKWGFCPNCGARMEEEK